MGKVSRALNKSSSTAGESHNELLTTPADTPEPKISQAKDIPPQPEEPSTADIVSESGTEGKWDERLLISTEYHSSIAENFRKLRTLILHPEDGDPPHSILVVSATAQEGKSFACANLGVCIASGYDQQAIILDFDLRRPSLHSLFGYKNTKGVVDYLSGRKALPELLIQTQLSHLSIVPAGPPPKNPSELITSEQSLKKIKELLSSYEDRVILIDTPPVLATSEISVLSQIIDKVLIVVRWGKSGRDEVKKIVEQIGRDKIIGVVFNAFEENILDRTIQDAGYYNYYSESSY